MKLRFDPTVPDQDLDRAFCCDAIKWKKGRSDSFLQDGGVDAGLHLTDDLAVYQHIHAFSRYAALFENEAADLMIRMALLLL